MLDWLRLFRASGLVTIFANLVAASVVMTYQQGGNLDLKVIGSLLIQGTGGAGFWVLGTSICLFMCGMLWNDLADVERDRVLKPRRPLPSGRIGLGPAYVVGTAAVVLALSFASLAGGGLGFQAAGLVLSLALFYDFAAKHVPWLGSMVMGSVRATHAVFALFLIGPDHFLRATSSVLALLGCDTGGEPVGTALLYPGLLGCYVFGVTLVSELESRSGRRWELAIGAACIVVPVLVAMGRVATADWIGHWQQHGGYVQLVAALFLGLAIFTLWCWRVGMPLLAAVRIGRRGLVGPAVGAALGGMILFDALIATSAHPIGGLLILLTYPIFLGFSRAIRMD
jgi:4-hydroxybenzoate polyprenyltransferase